MNIDEILYQQLLANEGKTRTTETLFNNWRVVWAELTTLNLTPKVWIYQEQSKHLGVVYNVITYKEHQQVNSYHELKADQEATRKRAQLGRERFQEFKADGLNPTISAALACLAEQIGMEKIKEAMAQAEKQVKGKK